jgi:DNA invertase Pin-like site-specific DNA recombinase
MAKKVMVIPASLRQFTAEPINTKKKRKTAGYARVSTDSEEQATSYEAQMDYYQEYIKSRDDWEFVGMYSDEGITATNTKHRDGFNQMVEDALAGKIDLIITKSVSRFARNTVDSLTTVRKLKEHGVEIYFEKENIWTLDAKGELLITIMSSLAQEESRSISENTTWGQRKRFADGRASVAYSNFLGYDKGFKVNEKQADTVRLIYKWFLEGYSAFTIAKKLSEMGVPTPMHKKKWHHDVVMSILKNEKYKGDALLQKYYTKDFLTKKLKKNEGEIQQYYVEGHHEAIISPAVFDLVQAEILRRNSSSSKHSGVSIFSSKIMCGNCGSWFGSKIWHSNDKYRKVIFQCNNKFKGKCTTPHLTEHQIKDIFVSAFNKLMPEKNEILGNMEIIIQTLCDNKSLEEQVKDLENEIAILVEMTQDLIRQNAHVAQNQEEYQKHYEGMIERYESKKNEYDYLQKKISERNAKAEILRKYAYCLAEQSVAISEFDGSLWSGLVDYVTVYSKEDIRVIFKDGTEITVYVKY